MSALHAAELKKEYQRIAGGYAKRNAQIKDFPDTFASAKKFVELLPKHGRILDLGCGNGRDSDWFASQGFEMTLFDLSDEMLAIAKQRVPKAVIMQGDMTELPFESESFDGVWANASLLHLTKKEIKKVLADIRKILRPDGIVFVSFKKGNEEKYLEEKKYETVTKRFFSLVGKSEIEKTVTEAGFLLLHSEEIGRASSQPWIHVFAQK